MKILVAEDDSDLRETLVHTLKLAGYEVTPVEDGTQAWERFTDEAFDVLVTDWTMPNLNGIQLIQRIRSLARETYPYIVMLTGSSGSGHLVTALEAGADDFLTKPIDRNVLLARLHVADRIRHLHSRLTRLQGQLSVCSHCHRVKRDDGSWMPLQQYLQSVPELRLSHGICAPCLTTHYPDFAASEAAACS